jgi:hypothetical protein
MREFEVTIESMTPCGGEKHARREIQEIETNDPMEWVREQTKAENITLVSDYKGYVIVAEQHGYVKRFTFTEF